MNGGLIDVPTAGSAVLGRSCPIAMDACPAARLGLFDTHTGLSLAPG
jgi:hypothetical protein